MNKIKTAVIGFGRMGITHFSILNKHEKVNIVAIVDPSKIVLELAKKNLNNINVYLNYKDLFEHEKLDAIIICTPPSLHFEIIKGASKLNLHVFCEKPFTTSANDAMVLTEMFENLNLINQVGYVNRFNDSFIKTRNLLQSNVIGKLIRFKSEMYSRTITKKHDSTTWRDSHQTGGGALFEVASHAIDLVNFLIGQPKKVIGSNLVSIFSKNVEDAISSTFLYNDNLSGTLNVNWSDTSYRKPTNKIELFGTNGKILADQHSIKIFLNQPTSQHNLKEGWNTLYITDFFNPVSFYVRGNEFTAQLYHFVESIISKNLQNKCTFRNGYETLKIIEQIFNDNEINGKIS
jgi:scyllo-inositol 2-dehydrogenase (NADP+)